PRYGILLDMVGAADGLFVYEEYSMTYAKHVAQKVWKRAAKLGHQKLFLARQVGFQVMDDHYYVNEVARIPSIDIIEFNPQTRSFGKYHHTHDDNMEVIYKPTLKAVGQTLLEVIYREK
ncbi:MAG: M28 family peptidase, partial [Salibacteraceae bacterium]